MAQISILATYQQIWRWMADTGDTLHMYLNIWWRGPDTLWSTAWRRYLWQCRWTRLDYAWLVLAHSSMHLQQLVAQRSMIFSLGMIIPCLTAHVPRGKNHATPANIFLQSSWTRPFSILSNLVRPNFFLRISATLPLFVFSSCSELEGHVHQCTLTDLQCHC